MNNMRKMFALAMVALMALTLALTVVGCSQQAAETPAPAAESTPPAETPMDGMMTSDSTMADTTAAH